MDPVDDACPKEARGKVQFVYSSHQLVQDCKLEETPCSLCVCWVIPTGWLLQWWNCQVLKRKRVDCSEQVVASAIGNR